MVFSGHIRKFIYVGKLLIMSVLRWSRVPGTAVAGKLAMIVAFDMATFPIFKDGDLYYPGVASLLSIINCGGSALIFSSNGSVSRNEKRLIDQLTGTFGGRVIYARNASGADMSIS